MAREMYLVGVSEEELRPDPKPEGPKTPKDKLSNFWYHYKWPVIIGGIVLVFLVILIGQAATRDDPDYNLILATEKYVDQAAADLLGEELQAYGRDLDGDGKVEVAVETLVTGDATQMGMANKTKLMAHLSSGDVMFFVFDKASYEGTIEPQLKDGYQFFTALDTNLSGVEGDGLYWNWKDDPLRGLEELSGLPENLYFGVRDATGTAASQKSRQMHTDCMELLNNFLTKTTPAAE